VVAPCVVQQVGRERIGTVGEEVEQPLDGGEGDNPRQTPAYGSCTRRVSAGGFCTALPSVPHQAFRVTS
jgi:hypothetical protein